LFYFCSIRSKHISHFPSISAPTSEKCLCSTWFYSNPIP
jgi:hypothetical protein